MAGKRKEATDFIISRINDVIPGNTTNGDLLQKKLDAMSDKEFEAFINGLKPRKELKPEDIRTVIPFYLPNLSKDKISIARMFQLVKKLGRNMSQRLIMTDPHTGVRYVTPHMYPCMYTVARRQAQTGYKKRSIPGVKQQIDDLSGQPTALSKGSRISSPERKFLDSRNLVEVQNELVHVRGGAQKAYREFRNQLLNTGEVDLNDLKGLGPAKSTLTLSARLMSSHLGNNLLETTHVPEDALPDALKGKGK